jgi:hypothetical protein
MAYSRMPDEALAPASELRADAWCGVSASGAFAQTSLGWAMRRDLPGPTQPLAPAAVDLADWQHPAVGWGVVLPDRDDVPAADKASGADAPEAIRALLAARGHAPVLRYHPLLRNEKLRRYDSKGRASDLSYAGARGTAPNAIPRYLLIVGSPVEIPWNAQYRMQTEAFVGRLDLDPAGLERYVECLLANWEDAAIDTRRPVLWAADHGFPDITRLMRRCIADCIHERLVQDPDHEFDMAGGFLSDEMGTQKALSAALVARHPAFVLTSSHGATFPLDDPAAMAAQLGVPIDHNRTVLDIAQLTHDWSSHGAIWYAHACCSAGADAESKFEGIVGSDSTLGKTLAGIAEVGACTAPLPRRLLGGSHPLRAFIGHVEPTFDWTLRDPITGQVTTHHVVDMLYNQLHLANRPPVGLALSTYFRAVAGLLQDYLSALDAVDEHQPNAQQRARRAKLLAFDRLAMVLLGDPTVRLPHAS